jgi:C-terminal processing protease CtpA/Prc
MADVQKIREGSKAFPMIWQAEYFNTFKDKANHKNIAQNQGYSMLCAFPLKSSFSDTYYNFWHTGIIYNADIPGLVAGLVPNSPADKAGIKTGDKIIETLAASVKSNLMFKNTLEKLNTMIKNSSWRQYYKIKNQSYTNPNIDNSKGIIFTIQRVDKSKVKITVYPEKIAHEWLDKK